MSFHNNFKSSLRKGNFRISFIDDKKRVPNNVCLIDAYDSQRFNLNDAGFIRNDISQLARAQSLSEYDAMLRKLQEYPSDSIPDNVSVEDAVAMIKPRNYQSPAELEIYASQLANRDLFKMDAAYRQALKDVKVDKPVSVTSNAEPKSE